MSMARSVRLYNLTMTTTPTTIRKLLADKISGKSGAEAQEVDVEPTQINIEGDAAFNLTDGKTGDIHVVQATTERILPAGDALDTLQVHVSSGTQALYLTIFTERDI